MFLLRAAPWGAVCVFLAATVSASPHPDESAPAPIPPPALQAALRDLWANSPQVQVADAELRAAQARARAAAQPLYNPSVQVEGENADVDRRTAGASLALDLFGKRRARTVESDAEVRASQAAYTLARRDVTADWLKAWASAILAREQTELGRRRLALMGRFDELAAQRLRVGDISTSERDLAGLALGEAQIQQASLVGQEAISLAALAAVGSDTNAALPGLPPALPPEADAIAPMPATDRPDLIRAQANQDRAEAGVVVAQRAQRPDPTVSLTGGRVRSGTRTDRVVGISVSIPIPILNTGRAEIAAAQADADAAFASRRATTLRSDAALEQTRATYAALRGAAASFRQSRANAFDERVQTLEKLWQASEIGTSDYLVQLKQSLDSALSSRALESQTWQAWFDYLAASGRLTEWIDGPSKDTSR
ncbi:cobalt-zinc-cadmium efflux system outer membrane protein [Luteibacter sp. OK325]|uniref:TolC family protein n=1 Tax=Luteibacter sp. OK325 TaxID=2135670 RepID=UPI000D3B9692|nr:TolC family protein [Luteibacter sp. OK325]PTR33831.1 cobalt-zinc-cadmium efflux system outer membrane protein [Luteibacter sp. OK325]